MSNDASWALTKKDHKPQGEADQRSELAAARDLGFGNGPVPGKSIRALLGPFVSL